jgi:hypothetical protein
MKKKMLALCFRISRMEEEGISFIIILLAEIIGIQYFPNSIEF